MTTTRTSSSVVFVIIGAALALPVLGQLTGRILLENNWNLVHWQLLPAWYKLAWAGLAAVLAAVALQFADRAGALIASPARTIASMAVLFLLFLLCQYDSFLYGGGNYRVAQIAQAERIVFRWYEFGATGFVSIPYQIYKMLGMSVNTASIYAWKTYAFLCTALTFVGAAYLVRQVTLDAARRVWTFLLIVFGAHTLSLLGLVGVEPLLPAAAVWALALGYRYHETGITKYLGLMWAVVVVAIVMYIGAACLLPAAVFATLFRPGKKSFRTPIILSALVVVVGVLIVYLLARKNPALAAQLLMPGGKKPFTDYGLFSLRRVSDIAQMRVILSSIVMGAVILWLLKIRFQSNYLMALSFVLALGTVIASLIIDPVNSPPLDLPNVSAYLLPVSVFAAAVFLWLSERLENRKILSAAAVVAFLCIAFVAPSFVRIDQAEAYVTTYFDQQPKFYRAGGLALRDVYFHKRRYDKADYWDQKLPVKSDDYLNYRGCLDLTATGNEAEASNILARTVAANPYWTEPRSLLAVCLITLGRPAAAKPHIDTCLMLEPYKKEHQMNLYRYYFAMGNRAEAAKYLSQMQYYFPFSGDVLSEVMMTSLADGRLTEADSLATLLMARDSMLALPYLAKARLAERSGSIATAINYYEKFMGWGKYRPEAASVGRHLYELRQRTAGADSQTPR